GLDVLELRATDSGFSQTITNITITNHRLVSIVAPVLTLEQNGTNRIAASSGGYKVALELVTTTNAGTWVVKSYRPNGTLFSQASAPIASVGQHIIYDDGGSESTLYSDPYYDVEVKITPPGFQEESQSDPPPPVSTKTIRVWLLRPRGNTGSITGYDSRVLPSNNGDKQFVLQTLRDGLSGLGDFICHTIDFTDGHWQVSASLVAIDL